MSIAIIKSIARIVIREAAQAAAAAVVEKAAEHAIRAIKKPSSCRPR